MNPHADADCPMAHAVGMLGDRWTLLIVREALDGASRYEDFKSRLQMSDNTLSRKLRQLTDDGLMERIAQPGRPVYRLTAAGAGLADVLAVLGLWTQHWFPREAPRRPPQPVAEAMRRLSRGGTKPPVDAGDPLSEHNP